MNSNCTVPKFGISQFTTWPWTFEQDIEHYAQMGADAIEVCEFKLDEARTQQQFRLLHESGLTVSSVQPKLHSLFPDQPQPEPREPADRTQLFRRSVDRFGAATPGATLVTISGAAPEGNYREAYRTAIREYKSLARYAGDRGVRIALEPLNPILMNVDTFICTLADAMEIVQAVDEPNFGIFVDVWHVWADADLDRNLLACGDKIFGVHVNDWHPPRHFGDRGSIGTGVLDIPAMLHAIDASGYRGVYTLELFSMDWLPDSLWRQDLAQVLTSNKRAFETAWQEAKCSSKER